LFDFFGGLYATILPSDFSNCLFAFFAAERAGGFDETIKLFFVGTANDRHNANEIIKPTR
jgi:hypothetical protein